MRFALIISRVFGGIILAGQSYHSRHPTKHRDISEGSCMAVVHKDLCAGRSVSYNALTWQAVVELYRLGMIKNSVPVEMEVFLTSSTNLLLQPSFLNSGPSSKSGNTSSLSPLSQPSSIVTLGLVSLYWLEKPPLFSKISWTRAGQRQEPEFLLTLDCSNSTPERAQ